MNILHNKYVQVTPCKTAGGVRGSSVFIITYANNDFQGVDKLNGTSVSTATSNNLINLLPEAVCCKHHKENRPNPSAAILRNCKQYKNEEN